jgi:hypothetical protein
MSAGEALRNEYAAFLTTPAPATVRRTMEALGVDVAGLLTVMRSGDGALTFKETIASIEGAWPACVRVRVRVRMRVRVWMRMRVRVWMHRRVGAGGKGEAAARWGMGDCRWEWPAIDWRKLGD